MPLYYLAFQRSPPVTAASSEAISVSPTIVNDLRDQVYDSNDDCGPLIIKMQWVVKRKKRWATLCDAGQQEWISPQSAYKACQLTIPDSKTLRGCETIRLALWAKHERAHDGVASKRTKYDSSSNDKWVYDIGESMQAEEDRVVIVPVVSAPINVADRKKGKIVNSEKSTSITRLFRTGQDTSIVEVCEESGYELDKVNSLTMVR
jgi:hypothetical protein